MGVEFNEGLVCVPARSVRKIPFFTRLVLSTGLVKTEATALLVLLIIAMVLGALSVFIFFSGSYEAPPPPKPSPYVIWPR